MKTKPISRWLAMILCAIAVFSVVVPGASATESADNNDGITDLIQSIIPSEGIGAWDEWEYKSSNVFFAEDIALKDKSTTISDGNLRSIRSSVEPEKKVYLGRYGWAKYPEGSYVTQYYPIWVKADANGDYHVGDMNYSRYAYCACPSMPGMPEGFHTGDIEKLSTDSDVSGATLNVFKAIMITSPYGPWGGVFQQNFWQWAIELQDSLGEGALYAVIHALLGYVYDPGSVGQPFEWSQVMKDNILGSGGMLEKIIRWAEENADICDLVSVYRIKGNGELQDIVWPEYEPLSKVTLKKVSANPDMTNGNADYSLSGAVYDVYKDASLLDRVGSLTTDTNGNSGTLDNLVPGTYYAKERTAPKGFQLSDDVLSIKVASGETGIFQASDIPVEVERIPVLRTIATVRGEHVARAEGALDIVDEVEYENVIPQREYTINATLMDRITKEIVCDAEGEPIKSSLTFSPEKEKGIVQIVFKIEDASVLENKTTVVFESISKDQKELATHADLSDEGQTIWWPAIHTTATVNGAHSAKAEGEIELADTVMFSNLQPGKEYTVVGQLMDKTTGEVLLDGDGSEITATQSFTPDKADGSVDITFRVMDASALMGKTTVAFETVFYGDREVAIHADIHDDAQTVYFPEIGTTATVGGEHEVPRDRTMTLVDVVEYKSLESGNEYTVKGVLIDAKTGEPFEQEGKEITAEINFTPDKPNGTVELCFEFDSSVLSKDTTLVAFETVYSGEKEVAVHAEIEDRGQTVVIKMPTMHTTATVSGKKEAIATNKLLLDDVVSYTGLVVGKEYVVKGVLMEKTSGKPYLVNGKEVVAETQFTPDKPDGEVTVTFSFDASDIRDKTTIVVFETMYQEGLEILTHADLDDVDQTVTINKATIPQTGDAVKPQYYILCFLAASFVVAALVYFLHNRKRG